MPAIGVRIRPIIILLVLSLATFISQASASSVVHGSVYEWSTFDTLNSAEVTVNSVPRQVMVSRNGSYSFNLDKGSYSIVASYEGSSAGALYAAENVTIAQDGGDYVLDLILFPSSDFSDIGFFDENITPIATEEPPDVPTAQPSGTSALLVLGAALIVLIIGSVVFLLLRKKKPPGPAEPAMPPPAPLAPEDATLPDDLREVVSIIEKNGGRITQLELRKALPYSEARVSLIVSDLESRGIVKKVKKGRGNIIILNKPE